MIRSLYNEEWKNFNPGYEKLKMRYMISNYGRMISYTENVSEGTLLKGSLVMGYRTFKYKKFNDGKVFNYNLYIHKIVAETFLPEPEPGKQYVIHLDHNKTNNYYLNLKWASKEEVIAHSQNSPLVMRAKKELVEHNKNRDYKLSATKVLLIKKKLSDPKRKTRLKMLAKQFGVSEMQLHRIKTGENWGHVKVDE
jgi:hypothetical protein